MGDTTIDGLIREAFDHLIGDMRVSMPGRIETFDTAERTATVKPMLSIKFRGSTTPTELPIIQNIPVVEPRTQKAILSLPIASGDPVLMVFADRAIENWLGSSNAQPSAPLDVRKHHLTDAFAVLGGWPTGLSGITPKETGAASIQVAPGTKIYLGNDSVELLDLLDQMQTIFSDVAGLFTTYQAHFHTSLDASGVPSDAAGWATALVTLQAIQAKLALIKV